MPKKNITNFLLYVIICFLAVSFNVNAQSTGKIAGKVTDASTGEALPGANVMLMGTNYGASSDRFGNYKFDKVPLGEYNLIVKYIGYEDFTTSVNLTNANYTVSVDAQLSITALKMDEIVISGLLQGQVKALNQQKNAQDIKNVLSREEMEKFPDMNTAEVLQRIPGISISRSLGEGSFVYIRGTEPRLTGVTVDGQKLASSEDEERFINLGVVNSSQLASIEVTKALTPDMDADAIGGTVNLVTRSPFDNEKPVIKVDLGGGYGVLSEEPQYRFSGSYSGFFGEEKQFGYNLSASYYRNNLRGHSIEMTWENVDDVNGNEIPFALADASLFDYNTQRDHYGVSGILEYKIDPNNSFHFRGMYNQFDDFQSRNMVRFRVNKGDYLTATNIEKARMAFEFQNRTEAHKITQLTFGGVHNFETLNLDYDFTYGFASQDKTDPGQIKSEWALDSKLNLALDLSDVDFPGFQITNADPDYFLDAAHWEIDNQDYRENKIENTNYTGVVNIKFPYKLFGLPAELKAGAKYSSDEKKRDASRSKYKWKGDDYFMNAVSSGETIEGFLLDHYTFGPMIDNGKVRDFFNSYRDQPDGLQDNPSYTDPDGIGGNYNTSEDIISFYMMTSFNADDLTVLAGVRDEYTKTDYNGTEILLDNSGDFLSASPVQNTNNYNNIFPYLHFRYKITPQTNLRLAATRSISRPNYWDLAPFLWINPDDDEIIKGNPELSPTLSTNLDLMLEHYFEGIGVISAGLFYKNLESVIYLREHQQAGGQYDGYDITEPVNGGSAELYGFEINWMQQFSFLPGFLSGFGVYANYTYTDSKADLEFRDWTAMPGQAADVGNFGISYEKYNLTARLSLNYSAEVLYQVGESPDYDRYNDEHVQIDFSGVYKLFDNVSFYLDLINITNAPSREYYGVTTRPRMNQYYGMTMRSGVKVDL